MEIESAIFLIIFLSAVSGIIGWGIADFKRYCQAEDLNDELRKVRVRLTNSTNTCDELRAQLASKEELNTKLAVSCADKSDTVESLNRQLTDSHLDINRLESQVLGLQKQLKVRNEISSKIISLLSGEFECKEDGKDQISVTGTYAKRTGSCPVADPVATWGQWTSQHPFSKSKPEPQQK